jgi:hypothetical protein
VSPTCPLIFCCTRRWERRAWGVSFVICSFNANAEKDVCSLWRRESSGAWTCATVLTEGHSRTIRYRYLCISSQANGTGTPSHQQSSWQSYIHWKSPPSLWGDEYHPILRGKILKGRREKNEENVEERGGRRNWIYEVKLGAKNGYKKRGQKACMRSKFLQKAGGGKISLGGYVELWRMQFHYRYMIVDIKDKYYGFLFPT